MLLLCGGLHTVWAIYQALFYETSEIYRNDLKKFNATKFEDRIFQRFMFSERYALIFTIIMWYVGVMIGCFVAGKYLVRMVQKRNIYVSNSPVLRSSSLWSQIQAISFNLSTKLPK